MNDDQLDRLRRYQANIHESHGFWGAAELAHATRQAAGEILFYGDAGGVHRLSQAFSDAARPLYDAQDALGDLRHADVDGVWSGDAHNAASDAVAALYDDVARAYLNFKEIADHLRAYGERMAPAQRQDESGRAALTRAAADAETLTVAGWVPDPFSYHGDVMRTAHHLAIEGIDARVGAHAEARDNGLDFAAAMHDVADQARARNLRTGMTPLDQVVLGGAGGEFGGRPPILTPAMEKRVDAALLTMTQADRDRLMTLLAEAESPEQRAYLLRTLAAGYSVADVDRFNALIAAHGNDPGWLDQHLSPLAMDGPVTAGPTPAFFGDATWTQGDHPTCVASSTVTARAEVDPLYALRLTTGGHPGDPRYDNPSAFADRLQDEQNRVYDSGRRWYENWWNDGMTDSQSDRVADQEIAPHTGVQYDNVDMNDSGSRESTLRSAEQAVDDGYPVPVATAEGDQRHQMMIIGHAGDQVQIYNPWGYTFWVSESDFVAGKVDGVDADIPSTPVSVRLPQEARR